MHHGHIPPKKYQDRHTMRRREDSRLLAAECTAGAVQLQECARLVQQQTLSCELQQGHCTTHKVLHLTSFTAPDSLLSPCHLSYCMMLKTVMLTSAWTSTQHYHPYRICMVLGQGTLLGRNCDSHPV